VKHRLVFSEAQLARHDGLEICLRSCAGEHHCSRSSRAFEHLAGTRDPCGLRRSVVRCHCRRSSSQYENLFIAEHYQHLLGSNILELSPRASLRRRRRSIGSEGNGLRLPRHLGRGQ
ncbi:unnamed protein product, partial [Polarella glacialis]